MNASTIPPAQPGSDDHPAVSAATRQLLAARIRAARATVEGETAIPARDPAASPRLSLAEEQLWFLEQFVGGTATYNISRAWRLHGPLDRTALRASVDALVDRHAALRTTFARAENDAIRRLQPHAEVAWSWIDSTGTALEARGTEAGRLAREQAVEAFDLETGPLARFALIGFAPDDHVFVITLHHIIADGWSLGLMLRELGAFYQARREGVTSEARRPARDYADFAAWQRAQARAGAFDFSLDYWEKKLAGAPAMLELPADRPRPALPSYRGELARARLPVTQAQRLAVLGSDEGASLFVVLLAAYQVLLYRHTGQEDLVVGSPFAGRTQPALDPIVGYFANMLPLRTRISGRATFRECVRDVRETVLAAFDRQDAPFAMMVERLRPSVRHAGVNPVFQAAFVLEESGLVGQPSFGSLRVEMVPVDTDTSKFDLSLLIIETADGLDLTVEASADLFSAAMPVRFLNQYLQLLAEVAERPDEAVAGAPLMPRTERQLLLRHGTGRNSSYPRHATVHGLFAEQARQRPDAVALATGDRTVTYAALQQSAGRLARQLRDAGVRPGEFVAVAADRSAAFVTALLAILRTGAAYVPLDVRHPPAWLQGMLDEVRPAAVLTTPTYRNLIPPTTAPVLPLDESRLEAAPEAENPDEPDAPASAVGAAYVMFTSGSTGRPKGTVVPHRAIVRLVRGANYAQFTADETILLLANLAFDASTFEIWGALLNGAKLAIPTSPQPTLTQIGEEIRRHGVTTMWLTTGLFNLIVDTCPGELAGVRQLLTGGEALSPAHAAKALAALPDTKLLNLYGPTENTVFTTSHRITAEHARGHGIPIGRPIANTSVYILDEKREPVPIGMPGELYAGGDGVAHGYINQPELTDQRFVRDPFSAETGARMYRTGDRARWREDGSIEFLGRIDQELKVRGFRVDTGEIEAALSALPGVAAVAVIPQSGTGTDRELVACVVPAGGASLVASHLRDRLASRLPPHMVPSTFTIVPSLPLTENGKIDRRVLASFARPEPETKTGNDRVLPRTATEQKLADLWRALLRCDDVGVHDDFFAMGGHSLLAMRLMHGVQQEFGQMLPLAALLTSPTIASLAARLASTVDLPAPAPNAGTLRGHGPGAPLFFIPGLGGYEFMPAPVARALEGCCPFFDGLQIVGVDQQAAPLEDLHAIAADLVRQIRRVCPRGPYNLCGYCYGGVVAFEVARQLEEAGETIPALVIWHGYPVTANWPRRSLPDFLRAIALRIEETPPRERPRLLRDKAVLALRMFGWRLSDEWYHLLGRPRSLIPHNVFFPEHMEPRVVYANLRARGRYRPSPYRGRVFLLFGDTDRLIRRCPPLAGWDGLLLGHVEMFVHPVEHMELVVPPAVDFLAGQTAACLQAATQENTARAARGFTAVSSLDARVRFPR